MTITIQKSTGSLATEYVRAISRPTVMCPAERDTSPHATKAAPTAIESNRRHGLLSLNGLKRDQLWRCPGDCSYAMSLDSFRIRAATSRSPAASHLSAVSARLCAISGRLFGMILPCFTAKRWSEIRASSSDNIASFLLSASLLATLAV